MIAIPLSRGFVATVDDIDADLLDYKWSANGYIGKVYALHRVGPRSIGKKEFLHRVVAERTYGVIPVGRKVDHIDRNTMNCSRRNVRIATQQENTFNSTKRSNNTSGFKGVSFYKNIDRWTAHIAINGVKQYLGLFDTPQDAAVAYDKRAMELYGDFAYLNFPNKEIG